MTERRGGTLTRDFRIADLLDQIHLGRMVLPEFQRDFDWGDERVSQLLATVIRRWPAGSLLLQEYTNTAFYELREFDGGPNVARERVDYVVLDGQQRLTALYHAIYDAGPYVYAVSAKALLTGASIEELEDGIRSFNRLDWDRLHRNHDWTPEHDLIPFYSLRSPADFFTWRDRATGREPHRDDHGLTLSNCYRNGLEAFHTFMLPAVVVEKNLETEAVARIFERVNRGQLHLSAFDLMVAKTYEFGWNLRLKWELAQNERTLLSDYLGDDGMPIIRVIAMKATDSVREGDVLRLPGQTVRQDWDAATAAMESALRFVSSRCGVRRADWLPYGGMLITLAGVALEHDLGQHEELLEAWFWSRAFGLRYEGGANTVTVDEYHHLLSVIDGKAELAHVPIPRRLITEATRKRRSAVWRAFMAVLGTQTARDVSTGEALGEEATPMHILPREVSPPPGAESQHLLVLNLVLARPATNRRVAGVGPQALNEELLRFGEVEADGIRESQLLPTSSNFHELIERRADALETFLRKRIGYGFDAEPVTTATDA